MTEGASHFCIETEESKQSCGTAMILGQYSKSFSYRVRCMSRGKTEDGENENTMCATCAGAGADRQTIG